MFQEENNNSLVGTAGKNPATVALLQEIQRNSAQGRKFNIAAANPLLAGNYICFIVEFKYF